MGIQGRQSNSLFYLLLSILITLLVFVAGEGATYSTAAAVGGQSAQHAALQPTDLHPGDALGFSAKILLLLPTVTPTPVKGATIEKPTGTPAAVSSPVLRLTQEWTIQLGDLRSIKVLPDGRLVGFTFEPISSKERLIKRIVINPDGRVESTDSAPETKECKNQIGILSDGTLICIMYIEAVNYQNLWHYADLLITPLGGKSTTLSALGVDTERMTAECVVAEWRLGNGYFWIMNKARGCLPLVRRIQADGTITEFTFEHSSEPDTQVIMADPLLAIYDTFTGRVSVWNSQSQLVLDTSFAKLDPAFAPNKNISALMLDSGDVYLRYERQDELHNPLSAQILRITPHGSIKFLPTNNYDVAPFIFDGNVGTLAGTDNLIFMTYGEAPWGVAVATKDLELIAQVSVASAAGFGGAAMYIPDEVIVGPDENLYAQIPGGQLTKFSVKFTP